MKRRALYSMLTLAVLITAMGTDYLASAGMVVRAEVVVNVAERMARRFTPVFPRRAHPQGTQQQQSVQAAVASPAVAIVDQQHVHQALACPRHILYLPPPLA
jgi:hypothetical protein